MPLGDNLATRSIKDGYCLPMIAELEDLLCIQGTNFRQTGFIEAVTSSQNVATQRQSEILRKYNEAGTPIESCLRYYSTICGKEVACPENICEVGDAPAARKYKDLVAGDEFCDGHKWTIEPCDVNNICGETVRSLRAREMATYVNLIVENLNKAFYSLAVTHCGGIYDYQTQTVSAAGTPLAFNILGKNHQPNAKAFHDLNRFINYNGCGTPFVVTSDNALMDYMRFRSADAYCCNQDGINLPNLGRMFGFNPYMDNSGGAAGEIAFNGALVWEPGAIRIRDSHDGRGDCTWSYGHFAKTTFTGPYGLVFDYQFRVDDCTGALTEMISLKSELFCKPLDLNECELAGTNGIFCLEFNSCAEDACA